LFWYNVSKTHGYRVTKIGYETLIERGYKFHQFKIESLVSYQIIMLDKYIMSPWYFARKEFSVLDEALSIAMHLCNNDIDKAITFVYS
jgi:hypothetical protein